MFLARGGIYWRYNKYMISIDYIRANKDKAKRGIASKNSDIDIDELLFLEDEYKYALRKTEEARSERNYLADKIASRSGSDRLSLLKEAGDIKNKVKNLEDDLRAKKGKLDSIFEDNSQYTYRRSFLLASLRKITLFCVIAGKNPTLILRRWTIYL